MKKIVVWHQITIDFRGRKIKGSYATENDMVTVRTTLGSKGTQRGGSRPAILARMMLRELAVEGKA